MTLWLDEEIDSFLWCLGATFRCTPSEAIGVWSVVFFYATFLAATVLHSVLKSGAVAAGRWRPPPMEMRRGSPTLFAENKSDGDDLQMLCLIVVYFFTFAAGCLAWVLGGTRFVHPFQLWPLQLLGSAMLVACAGLFVIVHLELGENWSPVPARLQGHALVTTGPYAWARHPLYAVLMWAAAGTLLATLNWLAAWVVAGAAGVTLRRIPGEERDMLALFGRDYAEYQRRVPALGFPFVGRRCWRRGNSTYEAIQ